MYENEKAQARQDFIRRFRWNNEDVVLMAPHSEQEAEPCALCTERPGTERLHDYEDDVSGGIAVCWPCAADLVHEQPPTHEWVSQVPEEAWEGKGSAAGNGWSGLWFLFAPPGRYASPMSTNPGEWPVERAS